MVWEDLEDQQEALDKQGQQARRGVAVLREEYSMGILVVVVEKARTGVRDPLVEQEQMEQLVRLANEGNVSRRSIYMVIMMSYMKK